MSADVLNLADVSVSRGRRRVVDNVSVALRGGGVAAICGPNGAGKSSLLAAIAHLHPFSGRISWNNRRLERHHFAYMPQSGAMRAELSVLEVVLLGRIERLKWRLAGGELEAALAALDSVNMAHLANRKINTLSGGQQQLVLLAQRLVKQPRLLLLDEPTSALDIRRQLVVLELLARYARQSGALVVMVLHDLSLAARYASTLLLIDEGRLIRAGEPMAVLQPAALLTAYHIETEVLRTTAGHAIIAPLRPAEGKESH
ncbi:ABC transporter ATP-binding protein [Affinibrenneria salicis]|uniref:ABC transporter ATP-binding protein n=1 Tax=Affinibrenneria salicis TaxID=2590031 RepID=A0A5J5G4P1_9GAMM|nr:ABC transporter ATP-binding protein [Affinibrenneria salicis]KAA9002027.1 ABC transporter ATP-binding protein [Affinibrenneria salicis]